VAEAVRATERVEVVANRVVIDGRSWDDFMRCGGSMIKRKQRGRGEGSIYLRKDGRWVASIVLEDHSRKYYYGQTRKEVQEKLKNAQYEYEQGILATGPQQTVKQYLEYWLEDVHKAKVRHGTYDAYRTILNLHLIPELGNIKLQKLTTQLVQSFYAKKQKQGYSASRVRAIHAVLHRSLEHAMRIKLVGSNVCDGVELPRSEQHEIQPLTPEQARLLLKKVQEHDLEALLTLALTTGMRKGEILALRWQDVDLQQGTLQIRRTLSYMAHFGFKEGEPKTAKSKRKIALPQFVIETLKRHYTIQLEARLWAGEVWQEHDLVFPNKRGGFIVPMTLANHFTRLLGEIGLPHIRFHDLRHSAATLLLSMGVPAKVVQEILGHSSSSTTMDRYSHVLPSMQQEAMEKMDDLFKQQL
jgi:integrase